MRRKKHEITHQNKPDVTLPTEKKMALMVGRGGLGVCLCGVLGAGVTVLRQREQLRALLGCAPTLIHCSSSSCHGGNRHCGQSLPRDLCPLAATLSVLGQAVTSLLSPKTTMPKLWA